MRGAVTKNPRPMEKKGDEHIAKTGSIIHWLEHKGGLVPVSCGWCKERHSVSSTSARESGFGGLHRKCYDEANKQTGDHEMGKYGSIYHADVSDPDDPNKRMVTCGKCGHRWYSTRYGAKQLKVLSGLCPKCRSRRLTGERTLPLGTKVLFDEPVSSKAKVAIICRGCKEEGNVKEVWYTSVTGYMRGKNKWQELCPECRASGRFKDPHTYDHDQIMEPFGSIIHWGIYDPNNPKRNMITCGLCGFKNSYARTTIYTSTTLKGSEWDGLCRATRACARRVALRKQEREHAAQNGSEHSNGNNGKRQGTSGGRPANDKKQQYEDAVNAIRAVWNQVRSLPLPFEERLKSVNQIKVGTALHLGEEGTEKSADQLRDRLEACGVKEQFPGVKQWYRAFVRSVVEKMEREFKEIETAVAAGKN